jgi:hypothetical protein
MPPQTLANAEALKITQPITKDIIKDTVSTEKGNSWNEKARSFWAKRRKRVLLAGSVAGAGYLLYLSLIDDEASIENIRNFEPRLFVDKAVDEIVMAAQKVGQVVLPIPGLFLFTFPTFVSEFVEAWPEILASNAFYAKLKALLEEPRLPSLLGKPVNDNNSRNESHENQILEVLALEAIFLMAITAYQTSSVDDYYLRTPIDKLSGLFRRISSYIPEIDYREYFVYYSRVFLESVGFLYERSVWHLNSKTESLRPAEILVSIGRKANEFMHYLAIRSSFLTLADIKRFFVNLVAETYEMILSLDLSFTGIKDIVTVFLEAVSPMFVSASSMFKLSFAKPFINTFEDKNVSKAASYFLERTFKEPFVIDDILKILLHCIRNEQFVDEAKVLGKIIVQDAANDKLIEEELTQLFVRIFQTNDIKDSAVSLVKFVFEQEDTKETLIQLFINAFKDERTLNALKTSLTTAMSDVAADKQLQAKLSDFFVMSLQPILKEELSGHHGIQKRLSSPSESAEDIRTFAVNKMDLMNLVSGAERQGKLDRSQNPPSQSYEETLDEQERPRRYERLRLLQKMHNSSFSGLGSF